MEAIKQKASTTLLYWLFVLWLLAFFYVAALSFFMRILRLKLNGLQGGSS
jgi:hypothetical protein